MFIPLSHEMLGRAFNGVGEPIDGMHQVISDHRQNINGRPINPVSRKYPRNYIQTGISSIDALITLIRGQKLPVFSGSGLAYNELAAQIVKQARIEGAGGNFAVVFGASRSEYLSQSLAFMQTTRFPASHPARLSLPASETM